MKLAIKSSKNETDRIPEVSIEFKLIYEQLEAYAAVEKKKDRKKKPGTDE